MAVPVLTGLALAAIAVAVALGGAAFVARGRSTGLSGAAGALVRACRRRQHRPAAAMLAALAIAVWLLLVLASSRPQYVGDVQDSAGYRS